MGMISIGFLLFMLLTSNPFHSDCFRLPLTVAISIHSSRIRRWSRIPPMLYMGYVGFSVAFAFAIAALIGGRLDADVGPLVATLDNRGLDVFDRAESRSEVGGLITN